MKIKKHISIIIIISLIFVSGIDVINNSYIMAEEINNQKEIYNEYSPKEVKILKENPIYSKESIEFENPEKVEGITDYILFYSKYNQYTIKQLLEEMTYKDILELDNEKIRKVKVLNYNEGKIGVESFYEDQVDIVDGKKADISQNKYHIYVASIGENGVKGISEGDKTSGTDKDPEFDSIIEDINNSKNKEEMNDILEKLDYPGWDEISDDSKLKYVSNELFKMKEKNNFKDNEVFKEKLCISMVFAYTNDNYKEIIVDEFIKIYDEINPIDFNLLNKEEKEVIITVVDNMSHGRLYTFDRYNKVLLEATKSIKNAEIKNPISEDEELIVGNTYKLIDYYIPQENEKIYWKSHDEQKAIIDIDTGEITPKDGGSVDIGYVVLDGYEIKAFGRTDINIKDTIGPKTTIPILEEGRLDSIMIVFNEKLSKESRNINNINDLIDKVIVDEREVDFEGGKDSVVWFGDRVAKVKFKNKIELEKDQILNIKYKDSVTDIKGNIAQDFTTEEIVKDNISPIGKVYIPTKSSNKIKIRFNEEMSDVTKKATKASDILSKIEVYNGNKKVETIKLKKEELVWDRNNNTLEFDISYEFKDGDYIKPYYTDKVYDIRGNKVSQENRSILIGGKLDTDDILIHEEMRRLSGGKNPKIGILYYLEDEDLKKSYRDEYISKGFEPIFIPISQYLEGNEKQIIDILNECDSILLLEDSILSYKKIFLNDDSKDSIVTTGIRQMALGSSMVAGEGFASNIQSELMVTGGTSYESLKLNKVSNVETSDIESSNFISEGLGISPDNMIIDSRFDKKGRIGRLLVSMRDTKQIYGVGIDEDTAIIFKDDEGKVIGSRGVFVLDSLNAKFNKYEDGSFEGTNIKINYLTSGDSINIKTGEIKSSKIETDNEDSEIYNSDNIFSAYETSKVLASLARSKEDLAIGLSKENEPQFTLEFKKGIKTKSYLNKEGLTISNAILDITNSDSGNLNGDPIISAKDLIIGLNEKFDPLKGVTASDEEDGDLTDKIIITENTVNTKKVGTYKVCYKVSNSKSKTVTKEIKVTVVKDSVTDNELEHMNNNETKGISMVSYLGVMIAVIAGAFINKGYQD